MKVKINTYYKGIIEVKAHKIKIPGFEEFEFFVNRVPDAIPDYFKDRGYYAISEFSTGLAVGKGKNFKDALLTTLLRLLREGKAKTRKIIAKQITKQGLINQKEANQ